MDAVATALAGLDALGAGLGPRGHAALDALRDRLDLRGGAEPGYFRHPLALPVVDLPVWTAAALAPDTPPPRVAAAVRAAAFGYLHVRLRDDLVDERTGGTEELLLSDILLHAHRSALDEAAAGRARRDADALWSAYAEAMLLDADLRAGVATWSAETEAQSLDRSMPLVLPALAVAPERARAPLTGLVRALVGGHQLVNDLVDFDKDLRNGNRTWVLHRAGAERGPGPARTWLLAGGGLDALAGEAHERFDAAAAGATALGLAPLAAFVAARRSHLDTARTQAYEAFFRAMLGSPRRAEGGAP